ncbi:MAG TPA: hypothetical protein V6D09_02565 [Leptolyngbyaceae cyanobacterium]
MSKTGRKNLDKSRIHARVSPETPPKLRAIAESLGYKYGDGGATGELLDAIANEEWVLVKKEEEVSQVISLYRCPANFTYLQRHFCFYADFVGGNQLRQVSIHPTPGEDKLFRDHRGITVSQRQGREGDWRQGVIKIPEIRGSAESLDDLFKLAQLGAEIAKDADTFFIEPFNWVESHRQLF